MEALSVKNVSKKFNGVSALDDVSLSIEEGEIFGLLGPNGAGKTTLINIAATLLLPTSGTVEVFGKDVVRRPLEVLETIGIVSGRAQFHWKENAVDILRFHAKVREVPNWRKRVDELIGQFEMGKFAKKNFEALSTGQQVKLMLAKALVAKPRFLMLDEPTIGLDPDVSIKVREIIGRLPAEGTTVLLTSHYMREIEELCDRIAFINRGKIVDIGTVSKLKSKLSQKIGLKIEVEEKVPESVLAKIGLREERGFLEGEAKDDSGAFNILAALEKGGFHVKSFEKREASLEDYFVRMAKEGKE